MLLVLVADQYTKRLVLKSLKQNQFVSLGVLDIRHVHNSGAAFGMLPSGGMIFVAIALSVLLVMALSYKRLRQADPYTALSLGLVAGGTIGNLMDRLRLGYVVDFIDFRWWPVFNVADSAICVGVGLLAWKMMHQQRAEHQSMPAAPSGTPELPLDNAPDAGGL